MDCNHCKTSCTERPKVQVPPCVNTTIIPGCGTASAPLRPQMERMSLAMGYVPMQRWHQTYPISQGFQRGTIFPELDLPFMMGRCSK